MVPELPRRRHPHIGRTLCTFVIIMCMSVLARGQDTEQQLQQLKQQLEVTTREFEQRISALELQLEKEKNPREQQTSNDEQEKAKQATRFTVSVAQEGAQKNLFTESNEVGAKFQS